MIVPVLTLSTMASDTRPVLMQISIATSSAFVRTLHQALAQDAAQSSGQRQPDLLLLVGWEEVDDAADRLLRVDRVQGGQDQVSGLSGAQSGMHRLRVAHLADQDDVRVLPSPSASPP